MTRRTFTSNRLVVAYWKPAGVMLLAAIAALSAAYPNSAAPPIIAPGRYTPGQSYFGHKNYIEYIAGDGPIILSAAHGGNLAPAEIPDRNDAACGATVVTTADANTRELVIAMQQAIHSRFGKFPHVVINHLHRRKLDANRPVGEAACGNTDAAVAWLEFHTFIDVAKLAVVNGPGKGWYMDMHGHGHAMQRLELGYLLGAVDLRRLDSALDAVTTFEEASSINRVSKDETHETFSSLLRGPTSLGALYAANDFPAVPSPTDPFPASGDPYFNGGFSTERHTCSTAAGPLGGLPGGGICGIQIEVNRQVRDTEESRKRFAEVTATILETYLAEHWDVELHVP